MTSFYNVYEDEQRARAYADLDYPGTYYLAFRDIPELLRKHISGNRALDFGCGAGRSTRFLRELGFDVTGIDVSGPMLREASARDPVGRYLLARDGFHVLGRQTFDLILCAFPFDNIPARDRPGLFCQLAEHLALSGRIVNLVSSPDIYINEWLSFSTRDFPENRYATSGDIVRIVMLDVPDRRPVEDVLWTDRDYAQTFLAAGLTLVQSHHPLGTDADPFDWVSEKTVSPWTIHILCKASSHLTIG
jgi:SAM-dependent methyltransferase